MTKGMFLAISQFQLAKISDSETTLVNTCCCKFSKVTIHIVRHSKHNFWHQSCYPGEQKWLYFWDFCIDCPQRSTLAHSLCVPNFTATGQTAWKAVYNTNTGDNSRHNINKNVLYIYIIHQYSNCTVTVVYIYIYIYIYTVSKKASHFNFFE